MKLITPSHESLSIKSFASYFSLIGILFFLSIVGRIFFESNLSLLFESEYQVFVLGTILFVGFLINRIAPKTIIPSFVWVIFAGITLEPVIGIFTQDMSSLRTVMELFAAMVLFSGGVEIPFRNFKQWFFPIATLSFVGVILTSVLFALVMFSLAQLLGIYDPQLMPSIIIVSIALASTDPTAIIPMMQSMKFKKPFIKQVAISESALTDISGSVLTQFLLITFISVPIFSNNVLNYFLPLASRATYEALSLQIVSGILVGYLGYRIMKTLYHMNVKTLPGHTDPALFLSIPIFTFVIGNVLGGAGFLAAFVAGLLTDISGESKSAFAFNESLLNHLIFPFIFIILGALVPVGTLIAYAPIGIIATLLFMFFIRPIVVLCTLFPWLLNHSFQFKDLVFLAMIRETGIIAAVLLVIATSYEIIQSEFVIAMGMWVILLTLIIEPPLTPYVAKRIGITK